jgi:hypothetical protein
MTHFAAGVNYNDKFAACVNYTGGRGKFTTGINNTGGIFCHRYRWCC